MLKMVVGGTGLGNYTRYKAATRYLP